MIIRQQRFNVDFFEFDHNSTRYRVGVGNYKDQEPGCEMFYPEAGSEYILVIFDNGWYKFDVFEFTHKAGIHYITEKLKCSDKDAEAVHSFISQLLFNEAALGALTDKKMVKNPFLR